MGVEGKRSGASRQKLPYGWTNLFVDVDHLWKGSALGQADKNCPTVKNIGHASFLLWCELEAGDLRCPDVEELRKIK